MPLEYVTVGDTTKKIAVDQVDTDKQVQYVKLMDATADAEGPLVVMQSSQPTLPASLIDSTGSAVTFASDITIEATPSIDASAYSDGDNLDGAIISWANATIVSGGSGYIDHVQVIDKSDSGGGGKNMVMVFCRSSITPNAQNAAFTLSDAQLEEVATSVTTADADWYDLGDGRIAEVDVSPPRPFKVTTGTTLYGVVKLVGAWTFGSTSDVIIRLHVVRN